GLDHTHSKLLIYSKELYMIDQHEVFTNMFEQLENYSSLKIFSGTLNRENLKRASFSFDGNFVIAGSDDGKVMIWNSNTAKPLNTILPPKIPNSTVFSTSEQELPPTVISCSFSPYTTDIVGISYDSGVYLFAQHDMYS